MFFLGVAVAGAVVVAGAPLWLLLIVALTGTLSTDVVDNGPATTLEQVMLAGEDARTARAYGRYNAVGAAAGALGALGARRQVWVESAPVAQSTSGCSWLLSPSA